MPSTSIEERFRMRVQAQDDANACWPWLGARHSRNGYGIFAPYLKKSYFAHRFAYELANGPIADGMYVCHSCDNPICVNPRHLFLGTPRDNVADMWHKDRGNVIAANATCPRGEGHPHRKLDAESVRAIRRVHAEGGVSQRELARRYGINHSTLGAILSGRTWKEVV